jgi:hypothetical protein
MHIALEPRSAVGSAPTAHAPLHFILRSKGGIWHLSEDTTGAVGGLFRSAAAALAFARDATRNRPGSSTLVERDDGAAGKAA